MNVTKLINDLDDIRQKCQDKMTDLDEVDEDLGLIIELLLMKK